MSDEFDKMEKAFKDGEFVALTKTKKGKIKFAGAYNSDRNAHLDFSADSPEGMAAIPEVVFVKPQQLPLPPINL